MGKNIKTLIFFLVLVLALIIFADSNKKKPINWSTTYGINDKIPFGLKVFNEESKGLFKNQNLEKFSETPYEFLYETNSYENDSTYYEENIQYAIQKTGEQFGATNDSGYGKFDHMLIPKPQKGDMAMIFEYKVAKNEKDLKEAAKKGLAQIIENQYGAELKEYDHVKKILKCAIAFYKKKMVMEYEIGFVA